MDVAALAVVANEEVTALLAQLAVPTNVALADRNIDPDTV